MSQVAVQLVTCDPPRVPQLVAGYGDVAKALARRLLELDDGQLDQLSCVGGDGWLLVRGATDQLPWVDGVSYLAAFSEAPELFVPTWQRPSVAPLLSLQALQRIQPGPLAWLRHEERDVLISLASLRRPGRLRLAAFCEGRGR